MRRRAVLATAATLPLAGCGTAVGESDGHADPAVSGLENSAVYHDSQLRDPALIDPERLFGGNDLLLELEFDTDSDYYPPDHDVYLKADDRIVDTGEGVGSLGRGMYGVKFYLQRSTADRRDAFRVVSLDGDHAADAFQLEVTERGD